MQPLDVTDVHHLRAAEGWLELGLYDDAIAELALIPADRQEHPDVLEVRWELFATKKNWDAALEIASTLLRNNPECQMSWLHHAYALRRASKGGLEKASDALLPAAKKFPKEPVIPFNLACYACQMGKLDDARDWLRRAFKIGGKKHMKLMALADDDLKPLWDEIQKL